MVKRLFHTGFALGRAPGLETWSFKVQNTNFIGLSYGQICPKDTFLKSLYENNDFPEGQTFLGHSIWLLAN